MPLLAILALGCSKKDARQAPASTGVPAQSVYTVNYPLAYFTKRLAPEGVEIVFPAPPTSTRRFGSQRRTRSVNTKRRA